MKIAQRSPPYFPQLIQRGDDDDDEQVESTPAVVTQDPQSEQGSDDNSDAKDQEKSSMIPRYNKGTTQQDQFLVVPQSQEGTYQTTHHLLSFDLENLAQQDQPSDPLYISKEPFYKVNPRWYVEGLQTIFEKNNHIIEFGQPMRPIYEERLTDLSGLVDIPLLWAVFDRYQMGWMT